MQPITKLLLGLGGFAGLAAGAGVVEHYRSKSPPVPSGFRVGGGLYGGGGGGGSPAPITLVNGPLPPQVLSRTSGAVLSLVVPSGGTIVSARLTSGGGLTVTNDGTTAVLTPSGQSGIAEVTVTWNSSVTQNIATVTVTLV